MRPSRGPLSSWANESWELNKLAKCQVEADEMLRRYIEVRPPEICEPVEAINSEAARIKFEKSQFDNVKTAITTVSDMLETERLARIESEKIAERQRLLDRKRFIINTVIGVVSAIASIIAAVAAIIALT